MSDSTFTVKIKTRDGKLDMALSAMALEAGGFRMAASDSSERADLYIFELSDDFDAEFSHLQALLRSDGVGEIFVTSRKKDPDLLLKAIKTGIKEFLSQPLNRAEVVEAFSSFKKRKERPGIGAPRPLGKVIHVIGAKGGVGTTTVAVNLARMLAAGKSPGTVALMEMNTAFGEIPFFLGVKPNYHWGQILENPKRLDGTFLMNILSKHDSGIHILSSPNHLNGYPPATAGIAQDVMTLMRQTFDVIVVDGGRSLEKAALKVMEMSDHVLLISLLQLACLSNTYKLIQSLRKMRVVPKEGVKIVINRYQKKTDISVKEASSSMRSDIFWLIPDGYKAAMSAINQGKALVDIEPKAAITRNLAQLADSFLAGSTEAVKQEKWKKGRFRGVL